MAHEGLNRGDALVLQLSWVGSARQPRVPWLLEERKGGARWPKPRPAWERESPLQVPTVHSEGLPKDLGIGPGQEHEVEGHVRPLLGLLD